MRIIYILFVACLLNTASAQIPAWEWGRRGGESEYERGADITVDAAGDLIVVGEWRYLNTNLFGVIQDTFYRTVTNDGFIAKFDTAGTLLWLHTNGMQYRMVATDAAGNIYVTGYILGNTIEGSDTLSFVNWGIFIAKYDSNGNPLWVKGIDAGPFQNHINGFCLDENGNAYIAGHFGSFSTLKIGSHTFNSNGSDDMFIAKYSPAGDVLWAKRYGGPLGDIFTGLAADADNNIVATATFRSSQLIVGTDTFHSSNSYRQPLVMKFDPAGNILWTKTTAQPTVNAGFGVPFVDNLNNIYITPDFSDSLLFLENDTLMGPAYSMVKLTPGGSLIWAKTDTTAQLGYKMPVLYTGAGEVYQVGNFGPVGGTEEFGVAKFDSSGNHLWTLFAPSTPSSYHSYGGVCAIDAAGKLYFTGSYYNADGYILLGNDTIAGQGVYVGKLDPVGRTCTSSASFTHSNQQNVFSFQNTSTGDNLSHSWNFGDGSTSTDTSATHTYATGNYNVCLTISDGAGCIDSACTNITVINNQDLVWPGDANHDGIANNFDLLAIGAGFGVSGPIRANATTNWVGQPSSDWLLQLAGGANLKHVDCDGDGTIGFDDVSAIAQNYGLTHAKSSSADRMAPGDLYLVFPRDSFLTGDTVAGEIHLGKAVAPVNNVYGIAFSLTYNQNLVDSGSLRIGFVHSWMAPDNNRISLTKDFYLASKIDAGLSRIDHNNASGAGKIADVSFVIQDNIDGKDFITLPLEIQFENVLAIDNDEDVVEVSATGDTLYVTGEVTGIHTPEEYKVSIFPNPAQNEVTINSEMFLRGYSITDLTGKEIITVNNLAAHRATVDVSMLDRWVYFISLRGDEETVVRKKIIVCR